MKIENELLKIDQMSHMEMAVLSRFASSGSKYFNTIECPELAAYFAERFKALGGMTPTLSKKIGWENNYLSSNYGQCYRFGGTCSFNPNNCSLDSSAVGCPYAKT